MIWLRKPIAALVLALGVSLSLAGCSGISVYNEFAAQGDAGEVVVENVAYGPDQRQKADIFLPANNSGNAPVIVFFYGGKWSTGSKSDYAFVGEAFSQRGYVTIVADYRLVPDVRYPAFVEDTAKAVAFAHRMAPTYGGDPQRLFVVGHSAGAYNAMMVTLAPEFLAAEGLSPSVIKGLAAISGPYDFKPLSTNITLEAFAGTKDFAPTQPINRVTPDATLPPILLLQGSADKLVRPRHAEKMAEVLRQSGKQVETIYYRGAGHARPILALGEPLQAKLPILDDIVSFFTRIAPQPIATAAIQG